VSENSCRNQAMSHAVRIAWDAQKLLGLCFEVGDSGAAI
jgi:hypothetical protein